MAGTYVFDVDAARKQGYSDAEIADFLGRQGGFDTDGARKAGYSDAEIVQQLSGKPVAEGGYITAPAASAPAAAPPAPAAKPSLVQDVTGFMANVNRGLGIGDELAAGAKTAGDVITGKTGLSDIPADYRANMGHQRQLEAGFAAQHPHVAALARGTGNALTMAAPIGPGAEAFSAPVVVAGHELPQVMANALRGADIAGLTGAGYAALDAGTPQERAAAAARAAGNPVTLGLGAVSGALATSRAPRAERAAAPTLEELTAAKDAAYKAVDDSGVAIKPEAFRGLAQDMAKAADDAGFHAGLHPKTAAMLERIGQSSRESPNYAPTLSQLDQLRQQIGRDLGGSADPGERRMGQILRDQIDTFIANARPDQLTGPDPATAAALLAQARDLNTRVQKLRTLDNLDEAAADRAGASGVGANGDNATRQNVIRFQNRVGNLTPAEQAATRTVIRGTPAQNALRAVGRLSPEGGAVPAGISVVTGAATHGAVPAVGFIARRIADALTARNVQALRDLIASGGQAAQEVTRQLADPQYADLRAQLANDLAVQAGVQGASPHGTVTVQVEGHPEYGVGTSRR